VRGRFQRWGKAFLFKKTSVDQNYLYLFVAAIVESSGIRYLQGKPGSGNVFCYMIKRSTHGQIVNLNMSSSRQQTVLLSYFRFPPGKYLWAMSRMAIVPRKLKRDDRISFFKMLGTGGGYGYSIKPDF
jgi:hypothetical protein